MKTQNEIILRTLSTKALRDELIGVTIGGKTEPTNTTKKGLLFAEYAQRAFPTAQIIAVKPIETTASLNSLAGIITLKRTKKSKEIVFGKIHIESNTKSFSLLGAENEYANAEMLEKAGWPVSKPIIKSTNPDYPLLLYPVVKALPLFDVLEKSYTSGKILLTQKDIAQLETYNRQISAKMIEKIKSGTRTDAIKAPVQALFFNRFKKDGRIDEWYTKDTKFKLPGLKKEISWKDLLDKKWNINGQNFDITINEIIKKARALLSFVDEDKTYLTISHGDDHAGNIRLTNPAMAFDPAFAGWNPVTLDVKALAHTGFLPMAALYYVPKGLAVSYAVTSDSIIVTTNMETLPVYQTQEILAKQIIDTRIIPLLKGVKQKGGDLEKEKNRMQVALVGCALLTINLAKLLNKNDGSGIGLLPMAIMLSTFQGLSILEYLNREIERINNE